MRRAPLFSPFVFLILAGILLHLPAGEPRAAVWPAGDIRVRVPFSRGNAIDLLIELQSKALKTHTLQGMTLEHIPGRGGLDAWATMDFSITNGGTLTAIELPGLFLRAFQPANALDLESMAVCHVSAYVPLALWVPEDSSFASLDDLVRSARGTPHTMQIAGPGTYSPAQLAAMLFDRQAGIQTFYMPFKGEIEAAAATVKPSGSANSASAAVAIVAFWADALQYPAFAGRHRPLAVAAETRSPVFPAVPTFRELGYDLVEGSFRGYVVPGDTSFFMRRAIFETFEEIRVDPVFQREAAALGFSIPALGLENIPEFMQDLLEKYADIAATLDIVRPGAMLPRLFQEAE